MSRWFRYYDGALDDPKVQRLPPELFKAWVNLLCVASRNGGCNVTCNADLAFQLRCSEIDAVKWVRELIELGLLDGNVGEFKPHNWDVRQHVSDQSNQRVREFREKKRNEKCNVTHAVTPSVTVTPPEQSRTDTDTEQIIREANASLVNETLPPQPDKVQISKQTLRGESDLTLLDGVTDQWNEWARNKGSPQVARLTAKRAVHCRRRIEDLMAYGNATPEEAFGFLLSKCDQSFFARGSPRKPLEFNQLMSEDFMTRMLEGSFKYEDRKHGQAQKHW